MQHPFLVIGSVLGALGVGLGAFGAHGLKKLLNETDRLATFETAVKYHLVHAVVLLVVGVLAMRETGADAWLHRAGWSFVAGTLIFSGTLYVLCVTGVRWLGAVTPIGGLLLIAGWVCLTIAATRL